MKLEAVLPVDAFFVPSEREDVEVHIGDVGIFDFFATPNEAARHGPPGGEATDDAGFALAMDVFIKTIAVGTGVIVIAEEEIAEQLGAQARLEVDLIVEVIFRVIVFVAADEIDSSIEISGIGPIGSGIAHLAVAEHATGGEALDAPVAIDVQHDVIVAPVRIGDFAVGGDARQRRGDAETSYGAGAGEGHSILGEASPFGDEVEGRSGITLARDEIDDAAVGIGAIKSGLCATHDVDLGEIIRDDLGEIEQAAVEETVDRSAVDFDQCVVGIPAANGHGGDAAARALLGHKHAWENAEQVSGLGFVPLANFLAGDDADAGCLFASTSI